MTTGGEWFKEIAALIVGLLGLWGSWANARADRAGKRVDRLRDIEEDMQRRGPMNPADLQVLGKHRVILAGIDEEIRVQEQMLYAAARRAGSGVSTALILIYAIYGAFLIWEGIEIDSGSRPVATPTVVISWAFAILGVGLIARAGVLAVRRWIVRGARKAIGLNDTYSRVSLRNAGRRIRALRRRERL